MNTILPGGKKFVANNDMKSEIGRTFLKKIFVSRSQYVSRSLFTQSMSMLHNGKRKCISL